MSSQPIHAVALGGGHGLAASLRALRRLTPHLTAVVGVSDNGGSSGRLRDQFNVIPPGDLRMALAALCAEDEWGQLWADALQHRFEGDGDLAGHALGNLLITALWQQSDDIVAGLDVVSTLLGAKGRVLPLSLRPLDVVADVNFGDGSHGVVRGQVQVATTTGRVQSVRLEPADAAATPEALEAIAQADLVVMGPGSWFTSVANHLLVDDLREVLESSAATKVLVCNLCNQAGETAGFTPADHLAVLAELAPGLRFNAVLVDSSLTDSALEAAAQQLGAELVSTPLADSDNAQIHSPELLAGALAAFVQSPMKISEVETAWQ